MKSIVWAMILIIPIALMLRILVVALTGQKKQGQVRSAERAAREDGTPLPEPHNVRDYSAHDGR